MLVYLTIRINSKRNETVGRENFSSWVFEINSFAGPIKTVLWTKRTKNGYSQSALFDENNKSLSLK